MIAPTLANLALDGLERLLLQRFPKPKNGYNAKVNRIRYADDFVVTGRAQAVLEHEVKPLGEHFLRARGLERSQEKTSITHIAGGFDFLGPHVRTYKAGKRHTRLITRSSKNVQAVLDKVRGIIKTNKAMDAGTRSSLLNPLIRGWANFHRHVVSKTVLNSVDDAIYHMIWRWAKRRQPNKPRPWVVKKYVKTRGGERWVFHGTHEGTANHLRSATAVPITRHTKINGQATPYARAWEVYVAQRLGVKMVATLRGRRQRMHLWNEQKGICPVCNQKITEITGWHNHHISWRSTGGPHTAENRVLLHPTCHAKVHSQGLYVEKPRPSPDERTACAG